MILIFTLNYKRNGRVPKTHLILMQAKFLKDLNVHSLVTMDSDQVSREIVVYVCSIRLLAYLILTSDRENYSRRCKIGGIWSQSKAKIKCEKNGKIHKFYLTVAHLFGTLVPIRPVLSI